MNPTEVRIAALLLQGLHLGGFNVSEELGVLSPYRTQVAALKAALSTHPSHTATASARRERVGLGTRALESNPAAGTPEISTVDTYQGRDKECLIISFVRSSDASGALGELLRDWRRVNVALTRARHKLIIIASARTLARIPFLNGLVQHARSCGWVVPLPTGAVTD